MDFVIYVLKTSGVPRGVGVNTPPPPPKFRRPSKIVSNNTRLWKLFKIAEFRTPTPQDVRKKGSKILKLPPVRNCFTLATTNKLVVIINSLKVPKIKKILVCEMKFLAANYSCLQNTWLGGCRPQIPVLSVLCPQLNLVNSPNSLKIQKIEKILLYEMKFLVPIYSCLQNTWLGGYRLQIPVLSVLWPQLNLLNPPPPPPPPPPTTPPPPPPTPPPCPPTPVFCDPPPPPPPETKFLGTPLART
jgi:hypothetical protein